MSRRLRVLTFVFIFAVANICACGDAVADADIYESSSDIDIGRVFLTAAERERLDRRRLLPAATAAGNGQPSTAPSVANSAGRQRQPAGYIVSSSGERSDWTGDSFVANGSRSPQMQSFPGDVKIVRHVDATGRTEQDDDADSQGARSGKTRSRPGEPHDDVSGNRE